MWSENGSRVLLTKLSETNVIETFIIVQRFQREYELCSDSDHNNIKRLLFSGASPLY